MLAEKISFCGLICPMTVRPIMPAPVGRAREHIRQLNELTVVLKLIFNSREMKKFISYLLGSCLVLGTLLFASCRKYLDKLPESEISSDQAFKNFTNFQGFTEQLYEGIPDFTNAYWTNNWNWGDDIVTSSDMDYQIVNMFDNGNF